MKRILSFLLIVFLLASVTTVAFAEDGFNASLNVDRSVTGQIAVTVVHSSVLETLQPDLSIPCDEGYAEAMVFFNGTASKADYADGYATFTVAKGGTYYIVMSAVPTESVPATCVEAGENTYVHNGVTYTEVIAATGEHSYTTKASEQKAADATCTEAATCYVQCDNCDEVSETETVSVGEANGHDFTDTGKKTCANCSVSNPNYEAPYVPPYIPPVTPTPDPEPEEETPAVLVGTAEVPVTIEDGVVSLEADAGTINILLSQADDAAITLDFTGLSDVSAIVISDALAEGLEQAGIAATVVLPYDLREETDPAELVIASIDEDGTISYNSVMYEDGTVSFTVGKTGTFSVHLCPSVAFQDVNLNEWYHESVDYMVENELMVGTGGDKFSPNAIVDRASLAMILWRMEGKPMAVEACPFSDVDPDAWYADAIAWAAEANLIYGYSDGLCHPGDALTREQMVTILWRYAQMKGYAVEAAEDAAMDEFADASTVSGFAQKAMLWAIENEVIEGTGKGLEPKLGAGRSQIAAIIYRYNQK